MSKEMGAGGRFDIFLDSGQFQIHCSPSGYVVCPLSSENGGKRAKFVLLREDIWAVMCRDAFQ